MIGPVYFNVKEAREFLLKVGFVYSLRKSRTTGKTIAVQGSYYNRTKLCNVRVYLIKRKVVVEDLYLYISKSGFNTIAEWIEAAAKFLKCDIHNFPEMLTNFNLYRIERVYENPHCPLFSNHSIRKNGMCKRFEICKTGGWVNERGWQIYWWDLTQHPLCQFHSHQSSNKGRVTGGAKKMPKESKAIKRETTAPEKIKTEAVEESKSVGPLLALTEENFINVMQQLGGKGVTTAQLLPYFECSKDPNPQKRWPKLRQMANKLAKQTPPKVAAVKEGRIYKYNLV